MRGYALVLLIAVPLCALGCANGRVSEQDDIRGTVQTFLDQCAEQRVLHVLPELVPSARKVVVAAPTTIAGCGHLLGARSAPTPDQLEAARPQVVKYDGARARVDFRVGSQARTLELSRGTEFWQIEAP